VFGIPKWNIALIVVLLAGMFGYATYFDVSTPEKTVEKFYQLLGTGKYDQAAEYLSVNWAYSVLFPKYNNTAPSELLKRESAIRKEMGQALAQNLPEAGTGELKVTARPSLTRSGSKAALVVCDYRVPNSKVQGQQLALLVKESGRWRLFELSDVTGYDLGFLKDVNMEDLDSKMNSFFQAKG